MAVAGALWAFGLRARALRASASVCTRARVLRAYSMARPAATSDRWWAIAALTLFIPAAVWIHSRRHASTETTPHAGRTPEDTVVLASLADLPAALPRVTVSQIVPPEAAPGRVLSAKYLLIGGGTASLSAAEEIRRLEPSADVMIVSEEAHPPYLRPPLSKELWFSADPAATTPADRLLFSDWHGEQKSIFFRPASFFETSDVQHSNHTSTRLLLATTAVALDLDRKQVLLSSGDTVRFEKLLIATGGSPRTLPALAGAPPDLASRFSTFRTVEDFARLRAALAPGKHIAVIGGGFLGSELAVALAQHSRQHLSSTLKITQLFPEHGNMALVFPRYLSSWTMSRVRRAGVTVRPKTYVQAVYSTTPPGGVVLSLEDGGEIAADHVLVAIGIEPNVGLARAAGLEIDEERGGIVTNAELQCRADVFAAGDVISFHDPELGVRRRVEHYDNAVLSGKLAAANMVDPAHLQSYHNQSMFWSDLGPEVGYEAVGIVDSHLTTVGVWAEASAEDSPRTAELDPSDIRVQSLGDIASRAAAAVPAAAPGKVEPVVPSPHGERTYGKGVVFYVRDRRVVGMLMFNLFNRLALARDVIRQGRTVDDLETIVELFNVHELPLAASKADGHSE